jgi:hypothetical protein
MAGIVNSTSHPLEVFNSNKAAPERANLNRISRITSRVATLFCKKLWLQFKNYIEGVEDCIMVQQEMT